MPSRAINVNLPEDVVARLKAMVTSGEYASETMSSKRAFVSSAREAWLETDVVKSFDEYEADPSIAIPAAEVSAGLEARLRAHLQKC
ncbi:type II toxin-antitoxin system ParD family antitoxin [Beijerinckia sp. L45]|uniref:type II toxin-antitoxin system ParD family antitoxin n=1 Tax=Beijerinckia sp. L45 TaxID=1641855 RepID=UPI00131DB1F2|nr:type II toxin-antitoxin system ParD family antitoxin [Beijerinckia sp. L45]